MKRNTQHIYFTYSTKYLEKMSISNQLSLSDSDSSKSSLRNWGIDETAEEDPDECAFWPGYKDCKLFYQAKTVDIVKYIKFHTKPLLKFKSRGSKHSKNTVIKYSTFKSLKLLKHTGKCDLSLLI